MHGPHSLDAARQQLADAISLYQSPTHSPLNVSPWVAMSALQKAIRRGQFETAQRAAATLLSISPERLWRRCGAIAFEDIGVADLDTVSSVTAALAGKKFRAPLGGEWPVASFIVSKMVGASKCRGADDLLLAAENLPAYEQARQELPSLTMQELIEIATSSAPLLMRALALWYAVGTDRRPSSHLRLRKGDPTTAFDALYDADIPGAVVEIAREGFRKVGEVLCPFVALLWPLRQRDHGLTEDDEFLPEVLIRDVPGWAYDTYTREGRQALGVFLEGASDTAHWVRAHIPPRQRVSFLGTIVFRVEGGSVKSRLRWEAADELRRLVDVECNGPHCPDATEILQLMRADLAALNEVRRHVC